MSSLNGGSRFSPRSNGKKSSNRSFGLPIGQIRMPQECVLNEGADHERRSGAHASTTAGHDR
eukprot:11160935-Alexandrium_andersonii.AAC.1